MGQEESAPGKVKEAVFSYFAGSRANSEKKIKLAIGQRLEARYSEDELWYSAIITQFLPDGRIQVRFLEYGNSQVITVEKSGLIGGFDIVTTSRTYRLVVVNHDAKKSRPKSETASVEDSVRYWIDGLLRYKKYKSSRQEKMNYARGTSVESSDGEHVNNVPNNNRQSSSEEEQFYSRRSTVIHETEKEDGEFEEIMLDGNEDSDDRRWQREEEERRYEEEERQRNKEEQRRRYEEEERQRRERQERERQREEEEKRRLREEEEEERNTSEVISVISNDFYTSPRDNFVEDNNYFVSPSDKEEGEGEFGQELQDAVSNFYGGKKKSNTMKYNNDTLARELSREPIRHSMFASPPMQNKSESNYDHGSVNATQSSSREVEEEMRREEWLAEKNEETDKLKEENEKLLAQIADLKEELQERSDQLDREKDKVLVAKEQVRARNRVVDEKEETISDLRKELEGKEELIRNINESSGELDLSRLMASAGKEKNGKEKMKKQQEIIKRLGEEYKKAKEEILTHQERVEFMSDQVRTLERKLKTQMAVKDGEIDELRHQLEKSNSKMRTVRKKDFMDVGYSEDMIDDFERLKTEYFYALGIALKLQLASQQESVNIDLTELYEEVVEIVHYKNWNSYIAMSFAIVLDPRKKKIMEERLKKLRAD